jgi:hypothetical protein
MGSVHFKEIFDYSIKEFKRYLEDDTNERIIFSGKYGVGKTSFLEEFFKEDTQKLILKSKKYDVYRLFPINYAIASNEDIIRYIKYDVIIEIIRKLKSVNDIDLAFIDTLPQFIKNNSFKIAAILANMIPKLGKDVRDVIKEIGELQSAFLKYHEEANTSEGDKMVEYLEKLENHDGSVYDNDIITKIIIDNIAKIKTEGSSSILIVDDIDRLDPEHVFRILNVFAAHMDINPATGTKNKFNFDKIIIVCDFHNIRNLFHHRYGDEADFMGYIDKFYSSDIYYFDNSRALVNIITKITSSIKHSSAGAGDINTLNHYYFNNGFIQNLLTLAIERGYISLRNIIKVYEKEISYHTEIIEYSSDKKSTYSYDIVLAMELKFLRDFFGDYRNMKKFFKKCLMNKEFINRYSSYFTDCIIFLSSSIHHFGNKADFLFKFNGYNIVIEGNNSYIKNRSNVQLFEYLGTSTYEGIPDRGPTYRVSVEMFWEALIATIDSLNKVGYLK